MINGSQGIFNSKFGLDPNKNQPKIIGLNSG